MNVSEQQTVENHERARLHCHYEGNPKPTVRWFYINPRSGEILGPIGSTMKDGIHILSELDQVLEIRNASYSHEGNKWIRISCNLLHTSIYHFSLPLAVWPSFKSYFSHFIFQFVGCLSTFKLFFSFSINDLRVSVLLTPSSASHLFIVCTLFFFTVKCVLSGEYYCEATNQINTIDYVVRSNNIILGKC